MPVRPKFDVVISGGGVAGLTLAALLGRLGLSVLVVEKQRQYRMTHKGELLQPRTIETLQQAGLLGSLRSGGAREVSALACRTESGADLVSLDYQLLAGPFRYGLVQTYREMLNAMAAELGPTVTLWRGSQVERLRRDDAGRIAGVAVRCDRSSADVDAELVVAADGQSSRLRHAAGIAVAPRRYPHQLVGFEMSGAASVGTEMNAYLTDRGLRALFDLPGGRSRLYVQVPVDSFRDVGRAGLPAWTTALLAATPALEPVAGPLRRGLGTVQVLSAYRFVADEWTRPGFTMIGDAAHCVHPMVGQGMNAAIIDAWELARSLAGQPSLAPARLDEALDGYEHQRLARTRYVARLSHNLAVLLTSTSWLGRTLRPGLLRGNQRNDHLRRRLTENMAGLTAEPFTIREWASVCGLFRHPAGPPGDDGGHRVHDGEDQIHAGDYIG
jgi:2-polyprenyl-6-methoxyphenol hydroxylase-like FAD-dependent oxidoreductase